MQFEKKHGVSWLVFICNDDGFYIWLCRSIGHFIAFYIPARSLSCSQLQKFFSLELCTQTGSVCVYCWECLKCTHGTSPLEPTV